MNITVRKLLWLFGVGNSVMTLFGAIAMSESNLSEVQPALIMNSVASTMAFMALGIGELVTKEKLITHDETLIERKMS